MGKGDSHFLVDILMSSWITYERARKNIVLLQIIYLHDVDYISEYERNDKRNNLITSENVLNSEAPSFSREKFSWREGIRKWKWKSVKDWRLEWIHRRKWKMFKMFEEKGRIDHENMWGIDWILKRTSHGREHFDLPWGIYPLRVTE